MRRILKQLSDVAGIKGSVVVTKDGIVVASHLSGQLQENVVGAVASGVISATHKNLTAHGFDDFSRFTLVATQGKMVFIETGPAFLVVVVDRTVELGPVELEIESAAMRIRKQGEIRV